MDIDIFAGETFKKVFRYATSPLVTKPITAITQAAPVQVTAPTHGITSAMSGWPAAVVSAKGMTEINSENYPPKGRDWFQATFVDADNVTFDERNSSDFSIWKGGGFLVYPTPVSLAGATGSFKVFDNVEHSGTPILTLAVGAGLVLDDASKTITVTFETAALAWTVGYYELVIVAAGVTTELVNGVINIEP